MPENLECLIKLKVHANAYNLLKLQENGFALQKAFGVLYVESRYQENCRCIHVVINLRVTTHCYWLYLSFSSASASICSNCKTTSAKRDSSASNSSSTACNSLVRVWTSFSAYEISFSYYWCTEVNYKKIPNCLQIWSTCSVYQTWQHRLLSLALIINCVFFRKTVNNL